MQKLLHWPLMLVGVQVLLGGLNVVLAAPGFVQISHLLLAQLVWVSVCCAYFAMAERQSL